MKEGCTRRASRLAATGPPRRARSSITGITRRPDLQETIQLMPHSQESTTERDLPSVVQKAKKLRHTLQNCRI